MTRPVWVSLLERFLNLPTFEEELHGDPIRLDRVSPPPISESCRVIYTPKSPFCNDTWDKIPSQTDVDVNGSKSNESLKRAKSVAGPLGIVGKANKYDDSIVEIWFISCDTRLLLRISLNRDVNRNIRGSTALEQWVESFNFVATHRDHHSLIPWGDITESCGKVTDVPIDRHYTRCILIKSWRFYHLIVLPRVPVPRNDRTTFSVSPSPDHFPFRTEISLRFNEAEHM